MKPLSKPRLGIVFMFSPLSPKTGPLVLWTPILPMERGWAAAARRFGSCMLLRCAPSCELGCRSAPSTIKGAASQSEALCWFFLSVLMLVHPIHLHPLCGNLRGGLRLCFGFASVYAPVLSYQLLYWMLMNVARGLERLLYSLHFFYQHVDYKHSHKAYFLSLFLCKKWLRNINLNVYTYNPYM